MTPKEQYEARKAARREKRMDQNAKDAEMIDMVDRFVTAVERIADAVEYRPMTGGAAGGLPTHLWPRS